MILHNVDATFIGNTIGSNCQKSCWGSNTMKRRSFFYIMYYAVYHGDDFVSGHAASYLMKQSVEQHYPCTCNNFDLSNTMSLYTMVSN